MNALFAIAWFVGLSVSVLLVFEFVGNAGITRMFPEGRRWWHLPVQLASLTLFAAVVLFHPFGGGS